MPNWQRTPQKDDGVSFPIFRVVRMAEGLPRRRLRRREEEEEDDEESGKAEAKKVEEGRSSRRIKEKKPNDNEEKKKEKGERIGTQSKRSDEKATEPEKTSLNASESDSNKLTIKENFPSLCATEKKDFELADGLIEKDISTDKMDMGPKLEAMEVDTKPVEEEMEVKEGKEEEKWVKGEKILCFHGPLIYEAKIQEVEIQNSIPK